MMFYIDSILNKITMYRLVLYYVCALIGGAVLLSLCGVLSFNPLFLIFSTFFILIICFLTNILFSYVYKVPTNVESVYITAFILALIITPLTSFGDVGYWSLAIIASVIAMASKYIIAIKKKHIFNPAAIGVFVVAIFLHYSATWWVGTASMLPLVLIGGLLVVRKIRRSDLVFVFLIVSFGVSFATHFSNTVSLLPYLLDIAKKVAFDTPFFFFGFIMLTEPLTTPPTSGLQMAYGALVGFLFASPLHIGTVYFTPEIALLLGNVFSYAVSPKSRLMLTLKEKIQLSPDVYDFVFTMDQKMKFRAGQYLEWTLAHNPSDSRGNRRYFTIASSPTERDMRIGVKTYDKPSSFKKALVELPIGGKLSASQLAGDFTLPTDTTKKLVFIAGGIGITPFRSQVKNMLDTNEKRDIVLLFSNKTEKDIVYRDVFDPATTLGLKTVYVVTNTQESLTRPLRAGTINEQMIAEEIPDYTERIFYISGPHGMVTAFEDTLRKMGVSGANIKVDFFPGFV